MTKVMERSEVYEALDSERDYQDLQGANLARPDMKKVLTVGETLFAIQCILHEAEPVWYKGSEPHPNAMELLRKIGGLAVQAGENYGMFKRQYDKYGK